MFSHIRKLPNFEGLFTKIMQTRAERAVWFNYAECSLFSPFYGKDNANEGIE